jgi:hypothetical protein
LSLVVAAAAVQVVTAVAVLVGFDAQKMQPVMVAV